MHQIYDRESFITWSIEEGPYICLYEIKSGLVQGSTMNPVHDLSSPARCFNTMFWRVEECDSWDKFQVKFCDREGPSCAHFVERRWTMSPGKNPHKRQAPDAPSLHFAASKSVLYRPDKICICTVAALTPLLELLQLVRMGWGPRPRGRNSQRRNSKLLRSLASWISLLCH